MNLEQVHLKEASEKGQELDAKKMVKSLNKFQAERDLPEYKRIMKLKTRTPAEEKMAVRYEKLMEKPGVPNAIRLKVLEEKKRQKEMLHEKYMKLDAANEVKELDAQMRNCNHIMEKIETVMKAEPEKEEVMTEERVSKTERTHEIGTKKAAREERER